MKKKKCPYSEDAFNTTSGVLFALLSMVGLTFIFQPVIESEGIVKWLGVFLLLFFFGCTILFIVFRTPFGRDSEGDQKTPTENRKD